MDQNSIYSTLPQHSLPKSIFLHLFPGVLVLVFYLLMAPYLKSHGYPAVIGVLLGFLLIGIPTQFFIMLREGKGLLGYYTYKGVLYYMKKLSFRNYLLLTIVFIVYAVLIMGIATPVSGMIKETMFSWLPEWYTSYDLGLDQNSSRTILICSFLAFLLIDGILNPVVEEIYFRGYLMPRLSRFRFWSVVMHAFLFALAHFWQPWNLLQIFILVAPIYYVVWKTRSLYISIIIHCLANTIGAFLTFAPLL